MKKPSLKTPLVSVIMAAHNNQQFIGEAIESVTSQTYINWEIIIVDDHSSDGSLDQANVYKKRDGRIKVISLPANVGPAEARNCGISKAAGRYIAFLDADDIWMPTKLAEQIDFMSINKYALCFTAYEKINKHGRIFGSVGVPYRVSYSGLLKTNVIGCLTAIYDVDYFGKVAMPLILKRQDYGLWLILLKNVKFAYGLNKPLAKYRVHGSSLSNRKLHVARYTWRLFREFEKLHIFHCIYYFSHYSIRGLLRNKFPRIAITLGVLKAAE